MVAPLKIVLLGRVGKTSLVCRFASGSFDGAQQETLQASFVSKPMVLRDRQTVDVAIWDTAGQERFHSLGPIYYRGADGCYNSFEPEFGEGEGLSSKRSLRNSTPSSFMLAAKAQHCCRDAAILVYDVTSAASFERVRSWIKELKQMLDPGIVLCIAANKQDTDPKLRVVPHAQAVSFAASVGASHFRTSARSGEGCEELFLDAAQRGFEARSARAGLNMIPGAEVGLPATGSRRQAIILDDVPPRPPSKASSCC